MSELKQLTLAQSIELLMSEYFNADENQLAYECEMSIQSAFEELDEDLKELGCEKLHPDTAKALIDKIEDVRRDINEYLDGKSRGEIQRFHNQYRTPDCDD